MAKSVRITDELYELALYEAALMERSLAQQIEHWVKLGIGVERSGVRQWAMFAPLRFGTGMSVMKPTCGPGANQPRACTRSPNH